MYSSIRSIFPEYMYNKVLIAIQMIIYLIEVPVTS